VTDLDAIIAAGGPWKRAVRIGGQVLIEGDCLEVMASLPQVGSVITDPPYGINTKSDGAGKLSPWADLCNAAFWYAEWLGQSRKLIEGPAKQGAGCIWSFLNWRSLVTFQKASCDIRMPIESLLVWDKAWIGPGGSKGLRPSYELVALFVVGDWGIANRGLPDIQQWPASSNKPSGHPAEKPLQGLEWLVTHAPPRTILDPFMGSGTTGVACIQTGRNFIGIEKERKYFEIAERRIAAAQPPLFVEQVKPEEQARQHPLIG